MSKKITPLQALERIKSHYKDKVCIDVLDDFDIIETALKDYDRLLKLRKTAEWADEKLQTKKKLKALEIVKEKGLDIREFRYTCSLYEYNICKNIGCKELSKDEFDFLKEVLL